MNSLSWLIYLADVVGNLRAILSASTFILVIGIAGSGIARFIFWVEAGDDQTLQISIQRTLKICVVALLFVAVISIAVPQRSTIMFIAASEFGEEIAQSDKAKNVGNKAYQALDKMLSEYLDTGKPE